MPALTRWNILDGLLERELSSPMPLPPDSVLEASPLPDVDSELHSRSSSSDSGDQNVDPVFVSESEEFTPFGEISPSVTSVSSTEMSAVAPSKRRKVSAAPGVLEFRIAYGFADIVVKRGGRVFCTACRFSDNRTVACPCPCRVAARLVTAARNQ